MVITAKKAIVFGGSAGSVKVVFNLLKQLPVGFPLPIIMALHRPEEKNSNMGPLFQEISRLPIIEPKEKTPIEAGKIYLAPSGAHMVVEPFNYINIDHSPLVQYSRPSIDVLFLSAAEVYRENLIGVLVTGSNEDGALGMKNINESGGITIVQDPKEAVIPRMPQSAINITKIDYILPTQKINELILKLADKTAKWPAKAII